MQYLMVGLALALFYLLLLALSEHMSFDLAYGISAGALVALITVYLTGVLRRRRLALGAGRGLATLYTMLYWILRSEDYSLLMGSLLLFGVLAMLMIATRRVDWSNVARRETRGGGRLVQALPSAAAARPNGRVALGAHRIEAGARGAQHRLARELRPAGIEGRRRRVFDGELNGFGEVAAADFGHDLEGHVDSGGDAAAGEDDAVAHHAAGVLRDAEVGELVAPRPVAGRTLAAQESGGREQQRARAHRGDVARLCAEPAQRGEIGLVFDGGHGAEAAGHAEQVAFIDAVEAAKAGEAHDGIHFELAARPPTRARSARRAVG